MNAMESLILRTTTRFMMPLLLVFSLFVLLRGHDEPGGGFIAGLVAAVAFSLYAFTFDARRTRDFMGMEPLVMLGGGLFIATLSGLPAILQGRAFFAALWWPVEIPMLGEIKLSTPLVFDIGVYMVVIGSVMAVVLALAEAEE